MAAYNPYNLSNSNKNLFSGTGFAASMGGSPSGGVEAWGGVADWSQPFSGKSNAATAITGAAGAVAGTTGAGEVAGTGTVATTIPTTDTSPLSAHAAWNANNALDPALHQPDPESPSQGFVSTPENPGYIGSDLTPEESALRTRNWFLNSPQPRQDLLTTLYDRFLGGQTPSVVSMNSINQLIDDPQGYLNYVNGLRRTQGFGGGLINPGGGSGYWQAGMAPIPQYGLDAPLDPSAKIYQGIYGKTPYDNSYSYYDVNVDSGQPLHTGTAEWQALIDALPAQVPTGGRNVAAP